MAQDFPGVEKWVTLGEGEDRKHVPIVDGKIGSIVDGHGAPAKPMPLEVMRKIHEGTQDAAKKREWEKKIGGHPDRSDEDLQIELESHDKRIKDSHGPVMEDMRQRSDKLREDARALEAGPKPRKPEKLAAHQENLAIS